MEIKVYAVIKMRDNQAIRRKISPNTFTFTSLIQCYGEDTDSNLFVSADMGRECCYGAKYGCERGCGSEGKRVGP